MPVALSPLARVPLWAAYFAAGVAALIFYWLLEAGSLTQSWFYDIIGVSAVFVALVGVIRNRPDRRLPWVLMAIGQASFVAGDVLWNWYEMIGEDPFPSMADALYLAGYPFIAVGLLLLIRRRLGDGDRGGLLDAAILATGVAILSWTLFIEPQVIDADLDLLSLAISLAYPVADLLIIGVAMGLLTTPGARTPAFRMLGISLVALLVADQIYALQNFDETYVAGGPLDSIYVIAYILFGVAVLHPSMRRLTDPHPVQVTWLGPVRLLCLAAAMVTGPVLLTIGPDASGGLAVIAVGTALLSLLVLARLYGLVGLLARDVAKRRALEDQLSYQAFHDPLTGLANRRRFVEQAEAALAGRQRTGTIAALFLDLDDFKTVNDSLGHAAGDEMLRVVAARIGAGLRTTDLAARLGGDEFGILLFDVHNVGVATAAAQRLLDALQAPVTIADSMVEVGASIGVAIDSPEMIRVDDLLGDADVAMYQAKALGKGRFHVFTGDPDGASVRQRTWSEQPRNVRRVPIGPALLEPGAG
jgi:diguanylate cyclase (GGDEF)-like protein